MDIQFAVFIGYAIFYIAFGLYILRPIPNSYNLLKIQIRLLPFNAKWFGALIIITGVFAYLYLKNIDGFVGERDYLFYNLNTGLLLFLFSKEHNEDELFQHLRMKSIVVSFINAMITIGIMYPMFFLNNEITDDIFFGFGFLTVMIQLYYLIYFYYSKYKLMKE